MSDPLHITVILGSDRKGRLCDKVADWTLRQLERHGLSPAHVIDPLRTGLPRFHGHGEEEARTRLGVWAGASDAFIIVTPEYNHSYTAALKTILDALPSSATAGKPVGFVAYGGALGGARAVEHLRTIMVEMQAMTVRNTVGIADAWDQFDADGQLRDEDRFRRQFDAMLDQLTWWGEGLRIARHARPLLKAA